MSTLPKKTNANYQTIIEQILKSEIDPVFSMRAKIILETAVRIKPKVVLDAGCGRGFYPSALSKFDFISEIVGIDINQEYLNKAKQGCDDKRVKFIKADIYNLPFASQKFDLIVSSEVMEHLDDDVKALRELKRVSKPAATLILSVPNALYPFLWDPLNFCLEKLFHTHINKDIWWLAGIWAGHVRLYTKNQLRDQIKKSGWKLERINLTGYWSWPFAHFLLYGIGKNLVERFGAKNFDRFNHQPKPLAQALSRLMALPHGLDSQPLKSDSSVGIVAIAKK